MCNRNNIYSLIVISILLVFSIGCRNLHKQIDDITSERIDYYNKERKRTKEMLCWANNKFPSDTFSLFFNEYEYENSESIYKANSFLLKFNYETHDGILLVSKVVKTMHFQCISL